MSDQTYHPLDIELGPDGESTFDLPLPPEDGEKPKHKHGLHNARAKILRFVILFNVLVLAVLVVLAIIAVNSMARPTGIAVVVTATLAPTADHTFHLDPNGGIDDVIGQIFNLLSPIFVVVTGVGLAGILVKTVGTIGKAMRTLKRPHPDG